MKNKNQQPQNIGTFLLTVIGVFVFGFLALFLIPNNVGDATFYLIPTLLFSIFIGYLAQFIVHEFGHLLFGLLTGYKFVSFRVGNAMLIKKNGKFRFANRHLPGTGGQCLMAPPEYHQGDFPFVLYNLGGVLLNTLVSLSTLWIVNENLPLFLNILLVGFALGGLVVAITNGFPMVVGGIPNDGHNIQSMQKDNKIKQAFWIQLAVNDALTQGKRPKDIPLTDFVIDSPDKLKNPLMTSVQLLKYNHYLDQMAFEKAHACLDEFTPYTEEIVSLYQNEIKLEALFLELIGENRPKIVRNFYDESLIQYIQMTPNWLNRKRMLMAYEWFQKNDPKKALTYYQELQELVKKHPLDGEASMEIELANWVKDKMDDSE